jgi:hypothetical protein
MMHRFVDFNKVPCISIGLCVYDRHKIAVLGQNYGAEETLKNWSINRKSSTQKVLPIGKE